MYHLSFSSSFFPLFLYQLYFHIPIDEQSNPVQSQFQIETLKLTESLRLSICNLLSKQSGNHSLRNSVYVNVVMYLLMLLKSTRKRLESVSQSVSQSIRAFFL